MNELSILEYLHFCTTRIETEGNDGEKYLASGFFFNLSIDEDKSLPIIVTNKHVIHNMKTGKFRITKANTDGGPIYGENVEFKLDGGLERWAILHPDNLVDLCIIPLKLLFNTKEYKGEKLFYTMFDNKLIPLQNELKSLDAIEDILMIGYPNGLWDQVNNMPIVRKGITATPVYLNYNGKKEFVIDAACFPGSSGSPVLLCNVNGYKDKKGNLFFGKSRLVLLGILYAGPQYTVEGKFVVETIPDLQRSPHLLSCIPNNLGFVIKSERILDFIPIIKQMLNKTSF